MEQATDLTMLKAIGAGLAAVGMLGSGLGLGIAFGKFFEAAARQPSIQDKLFTNLLVGAGLIEAVALFAFAVAAMIIFLL